MKTLNQHNVVAFDVDGTLVDSLLWTGEPGEPLPGNKTVDITTPFAGVSLRFNVKSHIVEKVKTHHVQGHYVIIWSQGGHEWAETVIKALGLEDYVDIIMTKPKWYYDDIPADEWMKRTIP